MAGGYFTAVGFGVLLSMILIAPSSAEGWFYPDATPSQASIPPDWGRTGDLLIRVEGDGGAAAVGGLADLLELALRQL